jgi:hypothetical protein
MAVQHRNLPPTACLINPPRQRLSCKEATTFLLVIAKSNLNIPPLSIPFPALALLSVVATSSALAQQPVRPLPKVGGCPVGYYSSGDYCVPSKSGNSRGAIEKVGNGCPVGFYASGHYCLSSPSNEREAMEKLGNNCPMGWYSSGSSCVTND